MTKTWIYRAYFERLDRYANGTIEAPTAEAAQRDVYGMCGEWYGDDTDRRWHFSAGCPDSVTVEEIV